MSIYFILALVCLLIAVVCTGVATLFAADPEGRGGRQVLTLLAVACGFAFGFLLALVLGLVKAFT